MNTFPKTMQTAQPDSSRNRLSSENKAVVWTLLAGVLLPLLDITLINVALHDIGMQLHASLATTQWVAVAYTLAAASVVPASGWAVNRIGGRQLWIGCLLVFMVSSILCALAWNVQSLIFWRVLQGMAAGLMMPVMQTILIGAVGQEKFKMALATMAIPSVLAPILGPLVGGFVLEHASWRAIFWLHVPICLLGVYLAVRRLPHGGKAAPASLDLHGLLLLCPAVVLMIFGMSEWTAGGSESTGLGAWSAGVGMVLAALFIAYARRKGAHALVDLTLFKYAQFNAAAATLFAASIVYYGGLLLTPLYLIQIGGFGVAAAGAWLALQGVGTLAARQFLEVMTQRWGNRNTALISVFATLSGSLAMCWPQLIEHPYLLAAALLIRGAGTGVLTIQAMAGAYVGLDRVMIVHASSVTRMLTHLGASIGAAGCIALMAISTAGTPLASVHAPGGFLAAWAGLAAIALFCAAPASRLKA
jgi:EmrB/QacA subfamily drug resistance transporter